ncbi:DUF349 domain-containing protein [Flectobacillus longus]|jgi:hypothetical protein|uniref:DUF349 domain-containing protein n=1 Tax=Flectobacillus longus TaxID=2984207 RepID=A0ABT6YV58_9BACT|nr:DUF349 domain-containing protein [Flectobacillus longus]MDI9867415.1 DUF349 domain-containing protein [Flectobacillus longus]MDI9881623.1 DUF349 domain-containing protein [Flectobacillus longus]
MENTVKNPAEYGYCKDGKVYLKGYLEYPDRLIGVVRNTEEEALQYFVNRFAIAENKVNLLFAQVDEAQNKGSYLTKLLQLRKNLVEFDGLGNFVPLLHKLDELELQLRELILNNQIKNLEIKRALIEEANQAGAIDDWARATDVIMEIKTKWLKTGPVDKALQDGIETEFNGIVDNFFVRRREYYAEKNRIIDEKLAQLQRIVDSARALRYEQDVDAGFQKVKDLQREWKTISQVPPKKQSMLWKQFKRSSDFFFERYNNVKGIVSKPRIDPRAQQMMDMTTELERNFPDQPNIPQTAEKAKAYLVKWKELSTLAKSVDRNLAERFRNICDKIFEMNYLLRVISYRHPALHEKPRIEQLKIMINQMDYMTKKEKNELDSFISESQYSGQMNDKLVINKINTQKRKISMKETLLVEFKKELETLLGQ